VFDKGQFREGAFVRKQLSPRKLLKLAAERAALDGPGKGLVLASREALTTVMVRGWGA
jgi:hypothetical protein